MQAGAVINSAQMIHIADSVARDKNISREDVLEAMEQAIARAGRAKYGPEHDIRAEINRNNGAIQLKRFREVVAEIDEEDEENKAKQLTLKQAQRIKKDAEVGEFIIDELPPLDFGRIAAQTAKQVILQKVREAGAKKQYEEFKDRKGEIVYGVVKRVEFGNLTVELSGAEGYLRRDELIQREVFRQGDRIRCYIYDVKEDGRGPQILLSRTHPQFMACLFSQEVPEVYEGNIEIRRVSRDPGSRAKMIVYTADPSIDPVGSCVGMRGSRVQAVVTELQGERVDIIPWSDDLATLVVRALAPADVVKVVLDEEKNRIEAVVPDEMLSQAIGRRGQNVRLASQLLGYDIDIMTETQESEKRAEEFKMRAELFQRAMDVDEVIAQLLVAEGFTSLEEVAYVAPEELMDIEGFDGNIAGELIRRAQAFLEQEAAEFETKQAELQFGEDLVTVAGLNTRAAIAVAEKGIKTLDDLGDLASDELIELLDGIEPMSEEEANEVIMAARAHWFTEEDDTNDENDQDAADPAKD